MQMSVLWAAAAALAVLAVAGAARLPASEETAPAFNPPPAPPVAVAYAPRAPPGKAGPRYSAERASPEVVVRSSDTQNRLGRKCPIGQKMDTLNICREIWN
ncbi:hypothetical protein R5R35_014143 [Gryllus longicercus]|uniref:Accessory gland protein n=1 Tax=Gryllus longicercus TaxID=2509291 RepID=A0AAN9VM68_9ORTH